MLEKNCLPSYVSGPVYMLTGVVDRNGNHTTLTYTGGALTTITNAYGRSLTLTYNGGNHLNSVTDSAGRVTQFQYDATGHQLKRTCGNPRRAVEPARGVYSWRPK